MSFAIGGVAVGSAAPPFIIAEMSGNHNQSLERALAIVDAIADSGAHALKLQTYTADTMTLDLAEREFFIEDPKSLWKGNSLYKLYEQAHTPWEWHEAIFKRAQTRGLVAFSTPFDATAVDFLESLDVPAYKIASFENTDLPLIRKVAATGKPVIISTGMATLAEIDEAVRTAREAGCQNLVLLKCTSSYPASPASSNLATIPHLKTLFHCEVGLSDHTLGIGAAVASVALGASVIEKHVTLSRAEGGVDAAFSLEPSELKQLVTETQTAWQALGQIQLGPTKEEQGSLVFRRTLYICEDLEAGDVLTSQNLRAIRPGYGLPPKFIDQLIGKRVARPVKRGTCMDWDLIS
ncbi:putative N-acetylneuramic acid synthetase (NeuB) [Legionella lansingensis]|uniref:Putative N-acetylneuramic acid synthetase (NeuB) n=1 Tax=Legionella lansingensis TaxID=45067 RepID=A0A0W0VWL2_9GAMM|nr:pseudaminic acid synthase [Legionella lansingensis]KTD24313.1 putative N-acetylneuramic acid synthetase (NeuB) [Legionella lansingensis]SNV51825.1 putative N-acetylneuramic acid synthetase (NeuB) [Legionella lansingensis]